MIIGILIATHVFLIGVIVGTAIALFRTTM